MPAMQTYVLPAFIKTNIHCIFVNSLTQKNNEIIILKGLCWRYRKVSDKTVNDREKCDRK